MEKYLTTVKTFLDANPNEVLTLIFTNPDDLSLADQWKPAFDNSGSSLFLRIYTTPCLTAPLRHD